METQAPSQRGAGAGPLCKVWCHPPIIVPPAPSLSKIERLTHECPLGGLVTTLINHQFLATGLWKLYFAVCNAD
jgi:hypothetical protein